MSNFGRAHLRSVSIPKAIFYTGLLTLAVLAINMSVFWLLGWYSGEGGLVNLCYAIMIEGAFMVFYGVRAWGRFPEHMLHPPRPTATVVFTVTGILLFLIGLSTNPAI